MKDTAPLVVVRPAHDTELTAIGQLTVDAYAANGYLLPDDPYTELLADTLSRTRDAELLVAVNSEATPLGTVTVCRPGTPFAQVARSAELEFRMLAVSPAARGQGIGAMLVSAVLDTARAQGYRRVVLSSLAEMRAAHRVYQRFGFDREPGRDWQPLPGLTLWAFGLDVEA